MNKTVFVIGAGFSIDAGAPSQAGILKAIFDLKRIYAQNPKSKIHKWLAELDNFLLNALCVTESQKCDYALEDIYTPIDKSLSESISFRNYTPIELLQLRDTINKLVILGIRKSIDENKKSNQTVVNFAKYITSLSRKRLEN